MRPSHRSAALLALTAVVACRPASTIGAQVARPASPPASGDSVRVSAPIANVRYDVTFDRATAARRTLRVAMTFDVTGDGPVLLSLPAWTPGAYEITNFAKWVSGFGATAVGTPAGALQSLTWDKVDHDTWRVRPNGARTVSVAFDFLADSLDNAIAWARPDFALFNGTNVFMYAEGRSLDFPATVSVHTDPAWLIATGMTPAGAPRRYGERNFHDLVDMPFFVGRFDYDSAQVAGKWMRLATYPTGSVGGALRAKVWDWIKRVVPPEVAVFGEVPWQTYTVMQVADSSYGGASGLEHQSSHVDVVTPLALDHPFMPSLYAHEIFHAWNVKRLRPADLVPYRYDTAQPTPWLWVSEGITDYYADLAEVRGGVVDAAGFYDLTAGKINEVDGVPAVSLEDASLSTWVSPTNGTATIYYPKGSLAGLMLDVLIRDASDNRRSLDDVMRELYRADVRQGTPARGFDYEQWWGAVTRAAGGRSFADFARRYVDGSERYPLDSILPLAGMRVKADTARVPQLGIYSAPDSGGVIVAAVDSAGAGAQAGVRAGDRLLAVGDIPVRDESFGDRFRAKYAEARESTTVPLRVRRGDQTLDLQAKVHFVVAGVRYSVAADPKASPKAARIRNGILRGVTDR